MMQAKFSLLSNISFFSLLFSMFSFWFYGAFFFTSSSFLRKDSVEKITNKNKEKFNDIFLQIGNLGMFLSNITLFLLLIFRWKESGHLPLSNLFESLLFLSWSCTLIHLGLTIPDIISKNQIQNFFYEESSLKKKEQFFINNSNNFFFSKFTGCITSPCALFTNAFASFSLPEEMQKITPLVPALQSNWLMMHVTVMIFSYSALIIGSLLSIAFLVITKGVDFTKKDQTQTLQTINNTKQYTSNSLKELTSFEMSNTYPIKEESLFSSESCDNEESFFYRDFNEEENKLRQSLLQTSKNTESSLYLKTKTNLSLVKFSETLDNLSYRIIGIGFPFLTIGILSGAVWANEAWGSYWSWDPKETWAFLTWLVFAIYLHIRISKGWQGKKPALIASLGFLVIWMCYLGVNLIGEGLHSYGWLVNS